MSALRLVDPPAITKRAEDHDAKRIGATYRKGTEAYRETGNALIAMQTVIVKKRGDGAWLPWLQANEDTLGFGDRTARRLMAFARTDVNDHSDVWGNAKRNSTTSNKNDVGTARGPAAVDKVLTAETVDADDVAASIEANGRWVNPDNKPWQFNSFRDMTWMLRSVLIHAAEWPEEEIERAFRLAMKTTRKPANASGPSAPQDAADRAG